MPRGKIYNPPQNDASRNKHDWTECEWWDGIAKACRSPMNCYLKTYDIPPKCESDGCSSCAGFDAPRLNGGSRCARGL